jgi:hypothetical protein
MKMITQRSQSGVSRENVSVVMPGILEDDRRDAAARWFWRSECVAGGYSGKKERDESEIE